MPRHDQGADADEHDQRREHHAVLVGAQDLLAAGMLVHQAFRDENGIVVPLAENERGQHDVDDVETQPEQLHDAQDPDPAHRQRQERKHAQFDAAEREPQEEEDDQRTQESDLVEVQREGVHKPAVDIGGVETEAVVQLCLPQARPDGRLVGLRFCNRHLRVIDQAGPSLIRQIHRRAQ